MYVLYQERVREKVEGRDIIGYRKKDREAKGRVMEIIKRVRMEER